MLRVTALLLLLASAGCTAHFPVNPRLDHYDPEGGYRLVNVGAPQSSDELLLILAFSGGGTRSAALAYGVLEELARTHIAWQGRGRRLLEEVDVISAVSGGSFVAAYYGLFGERIFEDFEQRFLKKNLDKALSLQLLVPANWARLVSAGFSRADLAARYYDKHIFDGTTFNDIAARPGPTIIINATDISLGTQFSFLQSQFDFICSDISRFPVARAVAASSAVPLVFTPITLRNHAGQCAFHPPAWFTQALDGRDPRDRRYVLAQELATYLNAERREYVHLADGGLSDNLGVRGPMSQMLLIGSAPLAMRLAGHGAVRKLAVIVVNAEAETDRGWDEQLRAPKMKEVLESVTAIAVSRSNFEVLALLRRRLARWAEELRAERCAKAGSGQTACADVDHYIVEVSFDALPEEERYYFKRLPTAFNLPAHAVDALRQAAGRILANSGEYQRLLRDLRVVKATQRQP